jgi:hypothetical protein
MRGEHPAQNSYPAPERGGLFECIEARQARDELLSLPSTVLTASHPTHLRRRDSRIWIIDPGSVTTNLASPVTPPLPVPGGDFALGAVMPPDASHAQWTNWAYCDEWQKDRVRNLAAEVWQQATWMLEMFYHIQSNPDAVWRKARWDACFVEGDNLSNSISPKYWFGIYSSERLDNVIDVCHEVTLITAGSGPNVYCGDVGDVGCHLCTNSTANQWWAWELCLCNDFWDMDFELQALFLFHELCHWLYVNQEGLEAVGDWHCCNGCEYWYDLPEIRELARECGDKAARNPDNYAYMGRALARFVRNGNTWPAGCSGFGGGGGGGTGIECGVDPFTREPNCFNWWIPEG